MKALGGRWTMKKATLNFAVDSLIGLAFLGSAVSGLVFLAPLGWISSTTGAVATVLGLGLRTWNDLHTASSLALIGGVLLHLILHARWIATMTRQTVMSTDRPAAWTPTVRLPSKGKELV